MKSKQINEGERILFLETWVLLLENGFDIHQSLQVMKRSQSINGLLLNIFTKSLKQGFTVSQCFSKANFSDQIVAQIALADLHGNLIQTMHNILEHMVLLRKQKKALQKVLFYPITLLIFVLVLGLTLRQFLIPQLLDSGMVSERHFSIRLIQKGPYYLMGIVLVIFCCSCMFKLFFRRKSTIQKAKFLTILPIVGRLYQLYITSLFALEWGNLFKEGLEMRQIIDCLVQVSHRSLITETAVQMDQLLQNGVSFSDSLKSYQFLLPEFPLIVFYGSIKGKVGEELFVYHHLLLYSLVQTIEKAIRFVQPVIFLLIALFILSIYLALFLPIYGNLEGVLN